MTWHSSPGFTLLEMLVVLAIIALAATALPVLTAGLPGVRLRAEADRIAGTLRDLRERAIREDATTELLVDPVTRTYTASGEPRAHRLPEAVVSIALEAAIAAPVPDARRIRFFADGTATGGTVVLRGVRRAMLVTVDWLSGAVHRR